MEYTKLWQKLSRHFILYGMKLKKQRGRPLAFDPEIALDQAMHLFWRKGYEGTSLSDLTEALGITRPSLYAYFGNKEALFKQSIERYGAKASYIDAACAMPTARDAVAAFLYGAAELMVDPEHAGCMLVTSCLSGSEETEAVQQTLSDARKVADEIWQARFERAKTEGDLPAETDTDALARYVMTISHGMSVHARGGASREDLRKVAELSLMVFPTKVK